VKAGLSLICLKRPLSAENQTASSNGNSSGVHFTRSGHIPAIEEEESVVRTLLVGLRAVVYMTGFLLFFAWLALRVRTLDRLLQVTLPGGVEILGVVLMLAGGGLGLACASTFIVRGKGTPAPFDAPREFVAIGPYRYVRNPMYVGGLILLAGFGLYERSISILLMALVLFPVVHLMVVFYEEPTLRKLFGATYEEYCRTTERWVPTLTRR
jgi:protein-S-isoprenylcysteine O-methyltransferase Ste14